jgi:hypothetical protein
MPRVRVYWWKDQPNFGDAMNPFLLERLFGVTATWAPLEEAELTGSGSVIQWISPTVRQRTGPIHVWGSGFIHDLEPGPRLGDVRYHAVRGPHTRTLAGADPGTPLGDPGLLSAEALGGRPAASHAIGVVPHLWDLESATLAGMVERAGALLIDVRKDPETVIRQIASCDYVFSSSLHGLIVADSFGIPTTWFVNTPLFGGAFKFDDYYASFGLERRPYVLCAGDDLATVARESGGHARPGLDQLRRQVHAAFPVFD